MRRVARAAALRAARVLSLVLLAALGSVVLMRCSPGYFTETREMDAAHAATARSEVNALEASQASVTHLLLSELKGWSQGDLGRSRHYDVPVFDLLKQRAGVTGRLLARAIIAGWLMALVLGIPLSARRGHQGELAVTASTAALLAIPVGVLATVSLLSNEGGPVSVLAVLIAIRDFKLLYRLLRVSWRAPHLLHARAQGLSTARTAWVHLVPVLRRELIALALMSLIVALSSLVPVEVIFDVPGLGQLAWAAAMNRDLPVLAAVTALLAACVGIASVFASPEQSLEIAQCG